MLLKWIEKSYDKHMSPNAQNEILQIMAVKVLRGIASDITESGCYRIMADESTDASNIEQLVICICWMDKKMTVRVEYIGLMPVTQTNADIIVVSIKDVLLGMYPRIQDAVSRFAHDWSQKWGCCTNQETK